MVEAGGGVCRGATYIQRPSTDCDWSWAWKLSINMIVLRPSGVFRCKFSAALLLVRDPVYSLLSEYNRQAGGHTGHAEDIKDLNNFLREKISTWRSLNLDWLENFSPSNLLVVSYSQLTKDLKNQLQRITAFLNVTISPADLNCTLQRREGVFKRKKLNQKVTVDNFNDRLLSKYKNDVVKAAIRIDKNFVL